MSDYNSFCTEILNALTEKGISANYFGSADPDPNFGEGDWYAFSFENHIHLLQLSKTVPGWINFILPLPVKNEAHTLTETGIKALCFSITEDRPHTPILYTRYDETTQTFMVAAHHGTMTTVENFKIFFDRYLVFLAETSEIFYNTLNNVMAIQDMHKKTDIDNS